MSSPKVASSELKTGVLKIPAHGETLSASALEEALALELKDCVWEIVGRKTYPDGVELSYKAISRASWEKYRNLPAKERPLTPQAEKTAAAKKIKTDVENILLVGG